MKKLLIFLFIALFPFSAISAPTNIPDVLITDVNNPNWVDVRRFTDIEPGLTALANKTATLRITKDVTLDNTYGAGTYSGVTVHIMPGFTCTITNPATYGFNVIVEDRGVLAIDSSITIGGNLTIKGDTDTSIVKITGNEVLTVSGIYNKNVDVSHKVLHVAGISALRLTVPIKDGEVRYLDYHTTLGDGGHGIVIWDADNVSADNNGTIILPTGHVGDGRWIRQYSGAVNLLWFGAVKSSTVDSSDAFNSAISFLTSLGGGELYAPQGGYLLNDVDPILSNYIWIKGDGSNNTTFYYNPSAAGTMLQIGSGSDLYVGGGISGVKLYALNTTHSKTALEINDFDTYQIRDLAISGATVANSSSFWGGGASSIGIKTKGRDFFDVSTCIIFADKPIVIGVNDNAGIDADHFHFHNMYLGANGNPHVSIESGADITQLTFDGYQSWVLGTYGFYWEDVLTEETATNVRLCNVRTEQGEDPTKYGVYVNHNYALDMLSIENCFFGDRAGVFAEKVIKLSLRDFFYAATGVGLNVGANVSTFELSNCFWQALSTSVTPYHTAIYHTPYSAATGALPSSGTWRLTSSEEKNFVVNSAIRSTAITVASGATVDIGANGANGFVMLSTDLGVSGMFLLQSATPTVTEVSDPAGFFTITKDNALTMNVYWDATASKYRFQNNRAASVNIVYCLIGSQTAF